MPEAGQKKSSRNQKLDDSLLRAAAEIARH
jgi:hypothetical protein